MTQTRENSERELEPKDYEIYHECTGVTHFLPPKRRETCGD
jgi:hypothetical protein